MSADSPYSCQDLVLPPWAGLAVGAVCGGALAVSPLVHAPLVLVVILGALSGWFYALCQQRNSTLGYILVGLSYGILLWIFSRLGCGIASHFTVIPEKPHIGPFLVLTECLACCAILASLRNSNQAILPKD